jgi:hypothetical protein
MTPRCRLAFVALVAVQVLHSIEEYSTHLYERLASARFVSGLVSDDLALGFAVINSGFILLCAAAYWGPVQRGATAARGIAWFLAWLEIANGVAHLALAASVRDYFPGALTAPLLIAAASVLAMLLRADGGARAANAAA